MGIISPSLSLFDFGPYIYVLDLSARKKSSFHLRRYNYSENYTPPPNGNMVLSINKNDWPIFEITNGDFRIQKGQMWKENKDSHSCMHNYLKETLKRYLFNQLYMFVVLILQQFLRFFDWILEFFWQCCICFSFHYHTKAYDIWKYVSNFRSYLFS